MAEPEPKRGPLDLTTWAGIGIVGLLVFFVGVYQPIWRHVKDGPWIAISVAIVGGIVVAIGFGFAYDLREAALHPPRQPPAVDPVEGSIRSAPSFEIYRPGEDDGPDSEKR
jgi:hypothetical protein